MKPSLSIIQGFLAAGKTTFSKNLAEETKAIRLNADEQCELMFTKEELLREWDNCFSKAIKELEQQTQKILKEGKSVILDFGFWFKKDRERIRKLAILWGAEFKHYYIDTPEEVIIERLKKRKGPIAKNNLKNYQSSKKMFEAPEKDENIINIG